MHYKKSLLSLLLVSVGLLASGCNSSLGMSFANAKSKANISYKQGDLESAIKHLSDVISASPSDIDSLFKRADSYAELERHKDAIADWGKIIELDPKNTAAIYNRGISHRRSGQPDKAIEDYTSYINMMPSDPDGYVARGIILTAYSRNHSEALIDFQKAVELEPENFSAHLCSGVSYTALERLEKAIKSLSRAIEIKPKDSRAYDYRSSAFALNNQLQNALDDANMALKIDPDNPQYLISRGWIKRKIGNLDGAEEDMLQGAKAKGDLEQYFYLKGREASAQYDLEKAMKLYNKAIEIDPTYVKALNSRGATYMQQENYSLAEKDFTTALLYAEDDFVMYRNRCNTRLNLDKLEDALTDCNKSIQLKPDQMQAYFYRGLLRSEREEHQEAIFDFSKAIEFGGSNPIFYSNRGIAYELSGDIDKACLDWELASQMGDIEAGHWVENQCRAKEVSTSAPTA